LKFVADINAATLPENTDPDWQFDYVDISRVMQGIITDDPQPTTFAQAPSRARRLAAPGDTIVSTVRTYLRAVAQVVDGEDDQVFSTGFAVIHPRSGSVDPRFLSYYLQSTPFVERVVADSVGVSYPAINPSQIGAYDLRLPGVPVQRAIADFLDRETAQIDAMIEAQETAMAHIQARRGAFIALTLDEASSVRVPLKRWIASADQGSSPDTAHGEDDAEAWVLKSGCPNGGRFDPLESKPVPAHVAWSKDTKVGIGDLIVSRANGSLRLLGSAALVGDLGGRNLLLSDKTYRLRTRHGCPNEEFVYWCLNSPQYRDHVSLTASGAEGLARNITSRSILAFPVPAVDAATAVAASRTLRDQSRQMDAVIAELVPCR